MGDSVIDGAVVMAPSFTCPRCERTSWHPDDVREGYCGACHDWTGGIPVVFQACAGCGAAVACRLGEPAPTSCQEHS